MPEKYMSTFCENDSTFLSSVEKSLNSNIMHCSADCLLKCSSQGILSVQYLCKKNLV